MFDAEDVSLYHFSETLKLNWLIALAEAATTILVRGLSESFERCSNYKDLNKYVYIKNINA